MLRKTLIGPICYKISLDSVKSRVGEGIGWPSAPLITAHPEIRARGAESLQLFPKHPHTPWLAH
jgi:hypothetical protein